MSFLASVSIDVYSSVRWYLRYTLKTLWHVGECESIQVEKEREREREEEEEESKWLTGAIMDSESHSRGECTLWPWVKECRLSERLLNSIYNTAVAIDATEGEGDASVTDGSGVSGGGGVGGEWRIVKASARRRRSSTSISPVWLIARKYVTHTVTW